LKKKIYLVALIVFIMFFLTIESSHSAVTIYIDETAYLADLVSLGYIAAPQEDFEDDLTWAASREPGSVSSIISQGVVWTSNFAANNITTGTGPARCEAPCSDPEPWGLFSMPHGNPDRVTNPTVCDVTPVPPECLMEDGFIATSTTTGTLFGAGGWVNGTFSGNVVFVLDGDEVNSVNFGDAGKLTGVGHQFFGVIDTQGFTSVEVRETEGKTGDQKLIFADDFTFAALPASDPAPDIKANGIDGPLLINQGDNMTVSIALDPGSYTGNNADWWIFIFYYNPATQSWIPIPYAIFQTPLINLQPVDIFSTTSFPRGAFIFFYGVDMIPNGLFDFPQLFHDSALVIVQ
jgi:hypothetical protein